MNTIDNTILNLILPFLITFWIVTKIAQYKFADIIIKKQDEGCDPGFTRTMNALSWVVSTVLFATQWTIAIAVALWATIHFVL